MTEQEVIDELKHNRIKTVAFLRLSEDTKTWIDNHINDYNLLVMTKMGGWIPVTVFDEKDYMNVIFCLDDDYQLEPKSSGEWVKFEIKSGVFDYNDRCFDWWDWDCFLDYCKCCNTGDFTAFGGWQYADSNTWFMTPKLKIIQANSISYKDNDTIDSNCYTTPAKLECKPAIPIKIRFWRESR